MNNIIKIDFSRGQIPTPPEYISRLKLAIAKMDAHEKNMQREIGDFKFQLNELSSEMVMLKASYKDLNHELGNIEVSRLKNKAVRLGQIVGSY